MNILEKGHALVDNIIRAICGSASRHPLIWFILGLSLCIPALHEAKKIGLDSNLTALLPYESRAAKWTRLLGDTVGDGGYFTIIFEGQDQGTLLRAVRATSEKVEKLDSVRSVEYRYPKEFYDHYRYLLIPDHYLEMILDYLVSLEAEYGLFTTDLLSSDEEDSAKSKNDQKKARRLLDEYSHLTEFHQSKNGDIMGMFIRPARGFTNIEATRNLYSVLQEIAQEASETYGIWSGVGGGQLNSLREYDVIISDLRRSGIVASAAILIILYISFRSFRVIPVLLYPLFVGLLWAFSLVPTIIGDLNTITSFLLLILFGVGIDYSIHLVKRFQLELRSKGPDEALAETFLSTGQSVIISGLTTALPLFILTASDFRGFSEFGLIAGGAIFILLISMMVVMPSTLILAHRVGLVKAIPQERQHGPIPPRFVAIAVGVLVIVSFVAIFMNLQFDYDFNNLTVNVPVWKTFHERHKKVYSKSMSPGALYVASDLQTLDQLLEILKIQKTGEDTTIERLSSLRTFAPDDQETEDRLDLIREIKQEVQGAWVTRIDDQEIRDLIQDIDGWTLPSAPPRLEDVPETLTASLTAKDGSGQFLVGVYPNIPRKDGRKAMIFTEELYNLAFPDGVKGPVGEMPIFAEILWLVTSEGPWIVFFTFLGVVLLVLLGSRSPRDTPWIVSPLIGGMILTLGIMAITGLKLNFFNVVVIPALLGMGVDHGIHFYRRWRELGGNTPATQGELFAPLSTCTVTTMMGYSGMVFANHAGLRSIGLTACLGLSCIWFTSLIFFPAVLQWIGRGTDRRKRSSRR